MAAQEEASGQDLLSANDVSVGGVAVEEQRHVGRKKKKKNQNAMELAYAKRDEEAAAAKLA